jgi:hypothetical protein
VKFSDHLQAGMRTYAGDLPGDGSWSARTNRTPITGLGRYHGFVTRDGYVSASNGGIGNGALLASGNQIVTCADTSMGSSSGDPCIGDEDCVAPETCSGGQRSHHHNGIIRDNLYNSPVGIDIARQGRNSWDPVWQIWNVLFEDNIYISQGATQEFAQFGSRCAVSMGKISLRNVSFVLSESVRDLVTHEGVIETAAGCVRLLDLRSLLFYGWPDPGSSSVISMSRSVVDDPNITAWPVDVNTDAVGATTYWCFENNVDDHSEYYGPPFLGTVIQQQDDSLGLFDPGVGKWWPREGSLADTLECGILGADPPGLCRRRWFMSQTLTGPECAGDPDSDGDGLRDLEEADLGTDPLDEDSDDDGLSDGGEVNTHGTDPVDSDSDDDGFSDGDEVAAGSNPLDPGSTPGSPIPALGKWGRWALAVLLLMTAALMHGRAGAVRRRWT